MPSKRKKNKRRMRRVQAQRRALEEQHAANPPVKASRGIAVSAPPAGTTKKAAKAPASDKILQANPVAVPVLETPKLGPKAEPVAEPVPVEVQAPEPEAVLLEQSPAEVDIEVPAPGTEQAAVVETPPVEPSTVETAVVQEPEPKIPETEPVIEVIPSGAAPVVASSETETDDACESQNEVEPEALAEKDTVTEVDIEVAVTEDSVVPEPVTEAFEKTAVEALSSGQVSAEAEPAPDEVVTQTVVETVVEVITDIPEPKQVTEAAVNPAAPTTEEEGKDEKEVLAEEDAQVPAETAINTEHAPVGSVEMAAVLDIFPEAQQEAEAPATETKENVDATLVDATPVDDSVLTKPDSAVEAAIESTDVQQETAPVSDTLSAQTESMNVITAEPEPAAAPAVDAAAVELKCLDRLPEEPKSEICDMPCQMQISGESVQLSTEEMPVETVMNTHIAPEVSIEG